MFTGILLTINWSVGPQPVILELAQLISFLAGLPNQLTFMFKANRWYIKPAQVLKEPVKQHLYWCGPVVVQSLIKPLCSSTEVTLLVFVHRFVKYLAALGWTIWCAPPAHQRSSTRHQSALEHQSKYHCVLPWCRNILWIFKRIHVLWLTHVTIRYDSTLDEATALQSMSNDSCG